MNDRISELTPKEIKKLTDLTIGHGKLQDASDVTSLHVHTIRNVRRLGYGKPETIDIIRKTLLNPETKVTA